MPSCFVSSCKNSEKSKISGLSFHRFPAKIKAEWLLALGLTPDTKIRHSSVVCSQHFRDSDYLKFTRYKFLRENVIPSINLPTKKIVFSDKNLHSRRFLSTDSSSSRINCQSTHDSSSYSTQEINMINIIINNLHSYCRRFKNETTKTSTKQYKVYLTALENDPVFNAMENNTIDHLDGDSAFYKKWMELTEKLNSVNGPKRTWDKWKQEFAEWKFGTRNKYLEMIKGLSTLEAKALYLWGSPEGTNLLSVNSDVSDPEEMPEESKSLEPVVETSFHCFLSTANNVETGSNVNSSYEERDSKPKNAELEVATNDEETMEIKYTDLIRSNENCPDLDIKLEDADDYTKLNIKTEDDFDTRNNEMNGVLEIKKKDLSGLEHMEDGVEEDENISTEKTSHLLNSMSSHSNATSPEFQENHNIFNTENDYLKNISTIGSSQIKKYKTNKGKVFYVQIEKIS